MPLLPRLLFPVALLAFFFANARAEQPAPPRNPQLDRIEQKLDDILKRLGAGGAPAPVSAPASALPPVAQSLSAPVPPPASLGTEYGAAPEPKRLAEPVSDDPPRIAPGHSLDELGAAQNRRLAPDRFVVIPRSSSEKN